MNDEIFQASAERIAELINSKNIKFNRGDPKDYFYMLSKVNLGLTTGVSKEKILDAIYLKNVYCLWNIIVDDNIDVEKTDEELRESKAFLSGTENQNKNISSFLLKELIINMSNELKEIFLFDLNDIIDAFTYEYIINKELILPSIEEYDKYSVLTAGINIYLDIDFSISKRNPHDEIYSKFRQAFLKFAKSVKYASDIGSLQREITKEKNMNIIILKAIEYNEFDFKDIFSGEYTVLFKKLNRIIDEVSKISDVCLNDTLRILKDIKEMDTSIIMKTMEKVVSTYKGGVDIFYQNTK